MNTDNGYEYHDYYDNANTNNSSAGYDYSIILYNSSATTASPAPTRLRYFITSLPHNSSLLDGRVNKKQQNSIILVIDTLTNDNYSITTIN